MRAGLSRTLTHAARATALWAPAILPAARMKAAAPQTQLLPANGTTGSRESRPRGQLRKRPGRCQRRCNNPLGTNSSTNPGSLEDHVYRQDDWAAVGHSI